jgi:uncharacterized membrane protein YheB (UPF0754 family)
MMTSHSSTAVLVSIPIIAALIGYVTNYIAVIMLFRPHRPVKLGFATLQGLVPRRQREIASSLGAMIERDLFSSADIQAALSSAETSAEAAAFVDEQVSIFAQKISAENPMVGMFMQGPLLEQVKDMLKTQITQAFPQCIARVVDKVEHKLDVSEIVREKVEGFDLTKLEAIIHEVSARELKTIEVLGGVLGFLVGLAQVGLMLVAG